MVLSAIVVILSISIVVGGSSDWRVHLSGHRRWVSLQGSSFWNQNQDASLIYQVFLRLGRPRPVDVEMLEMKIHENGPISSYSAEGVSIPCSVALRHAYYYACLMHLKRTLRKLALSGVQDLVDQIIHVLGTAEQARTTWTAPCLARSHKCLILFGQYLLQLVRQEIIFSAKYYLVG